MGIVDLRSILLDQVDVGLFLGIAEDLLHHRDDFLVFVVVHDESHQQFLVAEIQLKNSVFVVVDKCLENGDLNVFFDKILVHEEPEDFVLGLELVVLQQVKNKGYQVFPVLLDNFVLHLQNLVQRLHGILQQPHVL